MAKPYLLIFVAIYLIQASCSPNKASDKNTSNQNLSGQAAEGIDYNKINDNLDNFTIRNAAEDLNLFRSKAAVYSIKYYEAATGKTDPKALRKIEGKNFELQSYTEYLKDGRRRYRETTYGQGNKKIEHYHYDKKLSNLLLLHWLEMDPGNPKNHYNILNYLPNGVLKEEIKYRTYNGNNFDFEGYTGYEFQKNGDTNRVLLNQIGYDSIPAPQEIYSFVGDELIKQKPQYQSKKQYFKWLASGYQPFKTEGYIFDERNVEYTYDQKGFVTSETWMKSGELENKIEYEYLADYAERIQQNYHRLGTEKSSRKVSKYNPQGDLVFEQLTEYTGNKLNPDVYEYVYDQHDNWLDRKKYSINLKEGNKKELLAHEKREISYFKSDSKIRELNFPALSSKIKTLANSITKLGKQKQNDIAEFDKAVQDGDYESEITKSSAKEIKDFTPKFWKLKTTAYGDLDGQPGDEAVAVYETPMLVDPGFEQVLAIFKKSNGQWTLWHQSSAPIMGTQDGGMMGNPFDGISIAKKTIRINHFGGSRQKWSYTHIYRFQNNDWYLIGASTHDGAPCDYFADLDHNLSTGDVTAKYVQESCAEHTDEVTELKKWVENFKLKIPLPKMDAFSPGGNKVKVPNQGYEMYY